MDDLLTKALVPVLVAFVVTFVLSLLKRKAKEPVESGQLGYGPEFRAIGWFGVVVAVAATVVMFTVDHGGQYWAISGIAALFLVLAIPILLEGYLTTGQFDKTSITLTSIWRSDRVGNWTDLENAVFKKNGQNLDLLFADGTKIGLSKLMRGFDSVCDHVESIGIDVVDKPKP